MSVAGGQKNGKRRWRIHFFSGNKCSVFNLVRNKCSVFGFCSVFFVVLGAHVLGQVVPHCHQFVDTTDLSKEVVAFRAEKKLQRTAAFGLMKALPCPALPAFPALPCLACLAPALPCPAWTSCIALPPLPCPASPALPGPASPALLCLSLPFPCPALPCLPFPALPCLPCLALPCPALPCLAPAFLQHKNQ